jgi:hypothetical protein
MIKTTQSERDFYAVLLYELEVERNAAGAISVLSFRGVV